VQNGTQRQRNLQYNGGSVERTFGAHLMLIFIGVLVTLSTALVIRKVRAAGRADAASLGEVSEQWLAEHRASHPL
jgi:hypothetical protein